MTAFGSIENAVEAMKLGAFSYFIKSNDPQEIVFAKFIHMNSPRKGEIFMPVNCYSFSDSLIESELYGHENGVFTGSTGLRIGRFEAANHGTLFLDRAFHQEVFRRLKKELLRH